MNPVVLVQPTGDLAAYPRHRPQYPQRLAGVVEHRRPVATGDPDPGVALGRRHPEAVRPDDVRVEVGHPGEGGVRYRRRPQRRTEPDHHVHASGGRQRTGQPGRSRHQIPGRNTRTQIEFEVAVLGRTEREDPSLRRHPRYATG